MPPFVAQSPPVTGRVARGPFRTPATRNVRVDALIDTGAAREAPDPIRQGDAPARPARNQVYQALAIAPYRAVMRDEFWLPLRKHPATGAAMPVGTMLPWEERFNVTKPAAEPYGSAVAVTLEEDPTSSFLKTLLRLPG